MAITATLKIVLYANEVPVAESEDAALWHKALGAINGLKPSDNQQALGSLDIQGIIPSNASDAVIKFADKLEISPDKVEGALAPQLEPSYIHLDAHTWVAFRQLVPVTGPNAVSPATLAATALVLWGRHAGIDGIGTSDVIRVLEELGIETKNVPRSLRRCNWLQLRGEQIRLNPAELLQAEAVLKAFCLKQPIQAFQ
jgi:hypothetical protein